MDTKDYVDVHVRDGARLRHTELCGDTDSIEDARKHVTPDKDLGHGNLVNFKRRCPDEVLDLLLGVLPVKPVRDIVASYYSPYSGDFLRTHEAVTAWLSQQQSLETQSFARIQILDRSLCLALVQWADKVGTGERFTERYDVTRLDIIAVPHTFWMDLVPQDKSDSSPSECPALVRECRRLDLFLEVEARLGPFPYWVVRLFRFRRPRPACEPWDLAKLLDVERQSAEKNVQRDLDD